ncbi:MAG: hypothetical protein AABX98_00005, partial [Nanoarchaeota archaeon]
MSTISKAKIYFQQKIEHIKDIPAPYIIIFLFIFSFLWMFSLTYNFSFFWEDSFYIDKHTLVQQNPEAYSFQKMTSLFFDILTDPQQFHVLCYNSQPCRPLLYSFFYPAEAAAYGLNVIDYRIERALLFGLFISLTFFFFAQLKNASQSLFLPLLGLLSIIILSENWVMILYNTDPLPHVLVLTLFTFILFYFFYNNEKIQNKLALTLLFLCIVFFTTLSISLSHIGRIHFVIFFF